MEFYPIAVTLYFLILTAVIIMVSFTLHRIYLDPHSFSDTSRMTIHSLNHCTTFLDAQDPADSTHSDWTETQILIYVDYILMIILILWESLMNFYRFYSTKFLSISSQKPAYHKLFAFYSLYITFFLSLCFLQIEYLYHLFPAVILLHVLFNSYCVYGVISALHRHYKHYIRDSTFVSEVIIKDLQRTLTKLKLCALCCFVSSTVFILTFTLCHEGDLPLLVAPLWWIVNCICWTLTFAKNAMWMKRICSYRTCLECAPGDDDSCRTPSPDQKRVDFNTLNGQHHHHGHPSHPSHDHVHGQQSLSVGIPNLSAAGCGGTNGVGGNTLTMVSGTTPLGPLAETEETREHHDISRSSRSNLEMDLEDIETLIKPPLKLTITATPRSTVLPLMQPPAFLMAGNTSDMEIIDDVVEDVDVNHVTAGTHQQVAAGDTNDTVNVNVDNGIDHKDDVNATNVSNAVSDKGIESELERPKSIPLGVSDSNSPKETAPISTVKSSKINPNSAIQVKETGPRHSMTVTSTYQYPMDFDESRDGQNGVIGAFQHQLCLNDMASLTEEASVSREDSDMEQVSKSPPDESPQNKGSPKFQKAKSLPHSPPLDLRITSSANGPNAQRQMSKSRSMGNMTVDVEPSVSIFDLMAYDGLLPLHSLNGLRQAEELTVAKTDRSAPEVDEEEINRVRSSHL